VWAYKTECKWDHFPRATGSIAKELICFLFCLLFHKGRQEEAGEKKNNTKMTKCHCKIIKLSRRLQRKMSKPMNNNEKFSSEK